MRGEKIHLVFPGVGTNLFFYAGVWRAVKEAGYDVVSITGTSGGAVVGAIIACGYSDPDELEAVLLEYLPVEKRLLDFTPNFFYHKGLVKGKRIKKMLSKIFVDGVGVDDITATRIPLHVVTSRHEGKTFFEQVWSSDTEYEDSLSDIVYASMSFPVVFAPIKLKDGNLHSDGGITNNMAVDVPFDRDGTTRILAIKPVAELESRHLDDTIVVGWKRLPIISRAWNSVASTVTFYASIIDGLIEAATREKVADTAEKTKTLKIKVYRNSMNLFISRSGAEFAVSEGYRQATAALQAEEVLDGDDSVFKHRGAAGEGLDV